MWKQRVAFLERHAARGQVLHVAVLRRRHDLAGALLEAGFPVALAKARKWAPVDEAIALNDKRMVRPPPYVPATVEAFNHMQSARAFVCSWRGHGSQQVEPWTCQLERHVRGEATFPQCQCDTTYEPCVCAAPAGAAAPWAEARPLC